jgi:hypothetical protein
LVRLRDVLLVGRALLGAPGADVAHHALHLHRQLFATGFEQLPQFPLLAGAGP